MVKDINDKCCPLCQGDNQCGIKNKAPCWCRQSEMPIELINQVPKNLKDKSCICQTCLKKFNRAQFKEVN